MKKYYKVILYILIFINTSIGYPNEYKYILNEKALNEVYEPAIKFFKNSDIEVIKFPQGVIIRFFINEIIDEYYGITYDSLVKINKIKNFLANFENPVIIEVHTERNLSVEHFSLKNWEISTVIANSIEKIIIDSNEKFNKRTSSVGYGEFMPMKNTPNNGGKSLNRVDIIVLCSISGE